MFGKEDFASNGIRRVISENSTGLFNFKAIMWFSQAREEKNPLTYVFTLVVSIKLWIEGSNR